MAFIESHERREPPTLQVQLPLPEERPALEEAAITREALEEAWQAMEQALIQLDHLPPVLAWQVLLTPFGLQVVTPPASTSAPGAVEDAGPYERDLIEGARPHAAS